MRLNWALIPSCSGNWWKWTRAKVKVKVRQGQDGTCAKCVTLCFSLNWGFQCVCVCLSAVPAHVLAPPPCLPPTFYSLPFSLFFCIRGRPSLNYLNTVWKMIIFTCGIVTPFGKLTFFFTLFTLGHLNYQKIFQMKLIFNIRLILIRRFNKDISTFMKYFMDILLCKFQHLQWHFLIISYIRVPICLLFIIIIFKNN